MVLLVAKNKETMKKQVLTFKQILSREGLLAPRKRAIVAQLGPGQNFLKVRTCFLIVLKSCAEVFCVHFVGGYSVFAAKVPEQPESDVIIKVS